uniref:Uncharacterized protein n=1 Tax=Anopheles maculatus TaxID=74869 RepID=A0A182T606_9DIPT
MFPVLKKMEQRLLQVTFHKKTNGPPHHKQFRSQFPYRRWQPNPKQSVASIDGSKEYVQIKLGAVQQQQQQQTKMSSIGKVKSEFTITGRRSVTPTSITPRNTQIPVRKTPLTPQTAFERKKFLTRRKLMIGDAKAHLTHSSPSPGVQDVVHQDACEKPYVCSCDPELQGMEHLNPNCIYVNVCSEHARAGWSKYLTRLWLLVAKVVQLLVVCTIVALVCTAAVKGVYWCLGGKSVASSSEQAHPEDDSIFNEEEEENDENALNQDLMVLNQNGFSLTETTHAFSLLHVLIMTMARFFGWIGGVLLPGEE